MRLCFESIRIDEEYKRNVKSVVFYGDVKDQRFTHVGIPNTDFPIDSHEFWLCSLPRNSPYITLVGLDNEDFNVVQPNRINQTISTAVIQFKMPLSGFELGNNLVQIAWAVLPDNESSDMSLVRGTGYPLTIYYSFEFIDLYDNDLSFWAGFVILLLSQFWGQAFPLALVALTAFALYDLAKLFEAVFYLFNVSDTGHEQQREFTLINLIQYPVRRSIVNMVVLTPMVLLSGFQNILVLYTFLSTYLSSWFSFITERQIFSDEWFSMAAVTLVAAPVLSLFFDALMLLAFALNITVG